MSPLIYYLGAFMIYTVSIILLTGQSFAEKETMRSFYIDSCRTGWLRSLSTFCATWMSPLSLIGFGIWFYNEGWIAFWASVNGWMLGLLFFPFAVRRLRAARVTSLPEWLEKKYGDSRVRSLVALTMIFLYVIYLVIQFRAFGIIVSYMLEIPQGFAATSLIYLFVLYTTFGGYPSVARSDALNLVLIVIGVAVAAWCSLPEGVDFSSAAAVLREETSEFSMTKFSLNTFFSSFAIMLAWGLGVAGNPQYTIRIIACRSSRDAYRMLAAAPYIIGFIYFCLTFFVLVCRFRFPEATAAEETLAFAKLAQLLPTYASTLLLICVIASAVSTANSQLLLAACSLCYDFLPIKRFEENAGPFREERFLFINRVAVTVLASAALLLSHAGLPGYIRLGTISWTLVAIAFFYPLFTPRLIVPQLLFYVLSGALGLQFLLVFVFGREPELAMLLVLFCEALVFAFFKKFPGALRCFAR